MTGRFAGKSILVTGGTSGIGEATARLFAAEGGLVAIAGRNEKKGAELVAELGGNTRFVAADVTREEDIRAAIEFTVDGFGRLDCLFNNAGGPTLGNPDTMTGDEYRYAMDLLLGSVLFGIRHAAPIMKDQQRGSIINNSSVAALRGNMGGYLYSVAKAAVKRATEMAALELGQFGISVNCVSPGAVATPIFFGGSSAAALLEKGHAEAKAAKVERNLAAATPLHRAGLPKDVAAAVLFLASDEGSYVNGHDLVVDGGMIAGGRTSFMENAAGAPV